MPESGESSTEPLKELIETLSVSANNIKKLMKDTALADDEEKFPIVQTLLSELDTLAGQLSPDAKKRASLSEKSNPGDIFFDFIDAVKLIGEVSDTMQERNWYTATAVNLLLADSLDTFPPIAKLDTVHIAPAIDMQSDGYVPPAFENYNNENHIIIPFRSGNHWVMWTIQKGEPPVLQFFDPYGSDDLKQSTYEKLQKQERFADLFKDKLIPDLSTCTHNTVELQKNGVDCGVWVTAVGDAYITRALGQENISMEEITQQFRDSVNSDEKGQELRREHIVTMRDLLTAKVQPVLQQIMETIDSPAHEAPEAPKNEKEAEMISINNFYYLEQLIHSYTPNSVEKAQYVIARGPFGQKLFGSQTSNYQWVSILNSQLSALEEQAEKRINALHAENVDTLDIKTISATEPDLWFVEHRDSHTSLIEKLASNPKKLKEALDSIDITKHPHLKDSVETYQQKSEHLQPKVAAAPSIRDIPESHQILLGFLNDNTHNMLGEGVQATIGSNGNLLLAFGDAHSASTLQKNHCIFTNSQAILNNNTIAIASDKIELFMQNYEVLYDLASMNFDQAVRTYGTATLENIAYNNPEVFAIQPSAGNVLYNSIQTYHDAVNVIQNAAEKLFSNTYIAKTLSPIKAASPEQDVDVDNASSLSQEQMNLKNTLEQNTYNIFGAKHTCILTNDGGVQIRCSKELSTQAFQQHAAIVDLNLTINEDGNVIIPKKLVPKIYERIEQIGTQKVPLDEQTLLTYPELAGVRYSDGSSPLDTLTVEQVKNIANKSETKGYQHITSASTSQKLTGAPLPSTRLTDHSQLVTRVLEQMGLGVPYATTP